MKDSVHTNLLNAIKERVAPNTNMANLLTDILYIGKEAAYRRLRGEVQFTLEEVAVIAKTLEISLDNIIGQSRSEKSKPFQLKLTRYIDPGEGDYAQMEEYIALLNKSRDYPHREFGYSANTFPQTLYLQFPYLAKYYMFRWSYQWHGLSDIHSLDRIVISPKLSDIFQRYLEEAMHITKTYYIWDSKIFHYLVNDIKSFSDINFISKENVAALKEDILQLINKMETYAIKGQFDTGKRVEFYLSPITMDSTYSYLQMENFYLSQVNAFTLNAAVSLDKDVCDHLKTWIDSLKRLSILISESGEIQRIQFFREQRELINNTL